MKERYNRHIILPEIGIKGQEKLLAARVLLIGAGGLGCPIAQYLAAAGVGTIGIVDFDIVEKSNLQRQVLFGESALGKNKAIMARERLKDLNPEITIHAYPERLTPKNALDYFKEYDIIVDGTDNFFTRYLINDAAVLTNKPLIYGAIYKFEGQVAVFNYKGGPTYRCLFPKEPQEGTIPNCTAMGVLGVLPGIIGTMQANEVLKLILGIGEPLSGKILFYDALKPQTQVMKLNKNQEEIDKIYAQREEFTDREEVNSYCQTTTTVVAIKDVLTWEDTQFIDVRNQEETPKINEIKVDQIPLDQLLLHKNQLANSKKKVIFCQSGVRSKKAVALLEEQGITNCWSIKEGAHQIKEILAESVMAIDKL